MIKIITDTVMWLLIVGVKVTLIGMFLSVGAGLAHKLFSNVINKNIGDEIKKELSRIKEIQAIRKEIDEQGDNLTILLYNIYLDRCRRVRGKWEQKNSIKSRYFEGLKTLYGSCEPQSPDKCKWKIKVCPALKGAKWRLKAGK